MSILTQKPPNTYDGFTDYVNNNCHNIVCLNELLEFQASFCYIRILLNTSETQYHCIKQWWYLLVTKFLGCAAYHMFFIFILKALCQEMFANFSVH